MSQYSIVASSANLWRVQRADGQFAGYLPACEDEPANIREWTHKAGAERFVELLKRRAVVVTSRLAWVS